MHVRSRCDVPSEPTSISGTRALHELAGQAWVTDNPRMNPVQWSGMASTCRAVATAIVDRRSRDGQWRRITLINTPRRAGRGTRTRRRSWRRRGRDTPPRVPLRPTPRSKTRELTAPHAKTAKLWPGHILRLQSLPRSKTHKTPKRRRQAARGEILGASWDPDDLFSCPGSAQMDAWAYLHCTPAFLTYDTHFSDTLRTSQSALSANFWLRSFTCHKSGTYYFPSKCHNLQKKRQVSSPDLQNTQIPKRILL